MKRAFGCVLIGGAVLALVEAAAPAFGQSVMLRPKLEPGVVRYVERTTDMNQRFKGGPAGADREMTMKMKNVMGVLQKVESTTPDKGAKVSVTFDRIASESDMPMMAGEFDSDRRSDDESPELAALYEPMVGSVLMIELDKEGRAVGCTGTAELVAKVEKSVGGNPMLDQMKRNMNDEQNRVMWGEQRMFLYPYKDVKPGDKWTRSFVNKADFGDMSYQFECEAVKPESGDPKDSIRVAYTGKITQEGDPKQREGAPTVKIESGSTKGTGLFDPKVGEFVSQRGETELKLHIVFGVGDSAQKMEVQQKVVETVRTLSAEERAKEREANKSKPAGKAGGPG